MNLVKFSCLVVSSFFIFVTFPVSGAEEQQVVLDGLLSKKGGFDKKEDVECRKIRTTSSRIKRRICLSEIDWKRIEESSQALAREMYSSSSNN